MALNVHERGFSISKSHTSWQKVRSMDHFVFLNFYFGAKNAWQGNSLVVRRVSQGRIIIVLFWTKYVVLRQIKPGILKLTTSRGQRNLRTVFVFVSRDEKGCYRIVSLGHQNFDCRSYCGLSRRMQGGAYFQISCTYKWNLLKAYDSPSDSLQTSCRASNHTEIQKK